MTMYFSSLRRGQLYLIHFHNILKRRDVLGYFETITNNRLGEPVYCFLSKKGDPTSRFEIDTAEVNRLTYIKPDERGSQD